MSVRTILLTVMSVVALSHHALQAQEAGKLEVRVYSVADIVRSVPDYPYLPGLPTSNQDQTLGSPASSAGGFGGGGAIGGGGGGFFQVVGGHQNAANSGVPVQSVAVRQPTELDTLIRVIEASIAPETWAALGGEATIIALGTNLIVRQTADVHEEIRKFLQALSQQSDRQTMVTIRAFLLSPQSAEDKETWKTRLLERAKDDTQASKVMAELERDAKDLGQITCFSGQQVHLAAGNRRSVVSSATPVVSAFVTAYSPVITTLHIGTLLEFTATVEPGGESAMLDVRCTITGWNDAGEPIKLSTAMGSSRVPGPETGDAAIAGGGGALAGGGVADGGFEFGGVRSEAAIERVNLDTQQLATTVRVPVAAEGATPHPVVIGTLGQPSPAADPKDGTTGLTYLVIAISRQ